VYARTSPIPATRSTRSNCARRRRWRSGPQGCRPRGGCRPRACAAQYGLALVAERPVELRTVRRPLQHGPAPGRSQPRRPATRSAVHATAPHRWPRCDRRSLRPRASGVSRPPRKSAPPAAADDQPTRRRIHGKRLVGAARVALNVTGGIGRGDRRVRGRFPSPRHAHGDRCIAPRKKAAARSASLAPIQRHLHSYKDTSAAPASTPGSRARARAQPRVGSHADVRSWVWAHRSGSGARRDATV